MEQQPQFHEPHLRVRSNDAYFQAELDNMAYGKKVFTKTPFIQYVNFWPGEWNNSRNFMSRTFEFAATTPTSRPSSTTWPTARRSSPRRRSSSTSISGPVNGTTAAIT